MKKSYRSYFKKGSPHRLALAFALGIALGILPGTGAVVAAAVATLFRLHLPLMVAGALLTNPVTTPFIYATSYLLGQWVLGGVLPVEKTARFVVGTLAGNLLLVAAVSVLGYLAILGWASFLRTRRAARH